MRNSSAILVVENTTNNTGKSGLDICSAVHKNRFESSVSRCSVFGYWFFGNFICYLLNVYEINLFVANSEATDHFFNANYFCLHVSPLINILPSNTLGLSHQCTKTSSVTQVKAAVHLIHLYKYALYTSLNISIHTNKPYIQA